MPENSGGAPNPVNIAPNQPVGVVSEADKNKGGDGEEHGPNGNALRVNAQVQASSANGKAFGVAMGPGEYSLLLGITGVYMVLCL